MLLCVDVDECKAASAYCSINAACKNTMGSYSCECNVGFVGDGTSCLGKIFSIVYYSCILSTSHEYFS